MIVSLKLLFCTAVFIVLFFSEKGISQDPGQLPANWGKYVVLLKAEQQNSDLTVGLQKIGTGFLFKDNTLGEFLVTARHLLDSMDLVHILANKAHFDPQKESVPYHTKTYLLTKDSKPLWKGHPNINYDVAALKIDPPMEGVDVLFFTESWFKGFDSLKVAEDIYFYGFPFNVFGSIGKGIFPILRSGTVSYKFYQSTSMEEFQIDSTHFLIDGFSFEGNSGSPVLTKDTSENKRRLIGIVTRDVSKTYLVNGKIGRPTRNMNDYLLSQDTVTIELNTGLAIAICADRIRETIKQFKTK